MSRQENENRLLAIKCYLYSNTTTVSLKRMIFGSADEPEIRRKGYISVTVNLLYPPTPTSSDWCFDLRVENVLWRYQGTRSCGQCTRVSDSKNGKSEVVRPTGYSV